MSEAMQTDQWTDEACQAWVDDFEARLKSHLASGGEWAEFSQENVGTIPREVGAYVERQRVMREERAAEDWEIEKARREAAGELTNVWSKRLKKNLPGVEVVNTDHENG